MEVREIVPPPPGSPASDGAMPRAGRVELASRPVRVLLVTAAATAALIVLATIDAAGLAVGWEILHWNVSALGATLAIGLAVREARERDRRVRLWALLSFVVLSAYNIGWATQVAAGTAAFPSILDLLGLVVIVPLAGVLVASVHGVRTQAEEAAIYIDSAIITTAIAAGLFIGFGRIIDAVGGTGSLLAFAYPLEYLAIAAAGAVALVAIRHPIGPGGGFWLVAGCVLVGIAYLGWAVPAATSGADAGQPVGALFSVGVLLIGFGAATWHQAVSGDPRYLAIAAWLSRGAGPLAAGFLLLTLIVEPSLPRSLEDPYHIALVVTGALILLRQALLLRERTMTLDAVRALQVENERLVLELQQELAERARMQDHVISASRMAAVGELAAGVAHEVNNPLTGVLGYAELLLEDLDEDDPRRADVVTIRDEAMRARGIIRALRDFARPHEPRPIPTDLPQLVARTLELVRYPLVRAGVMIAESYGELPLIQLDPQAIQQVILNVLTNAMQAMPDGGRLLVQTSVRDTEAVVTITDTGVGMDESVAAQAFVPFFSARRASGAPGLGLSVSHGLIEAHHGTIRLESRAGTGTTVEICLPIASDAAAVARPDGAWLA